MPIFNRRPRYVEFFAGGGLVRAGLSESWDCVLANDIDARKCETYRTNWGDSHLIEDDVRNLDSKHLYQPIDMYWASSPCQDFSLAGQGAGLSGSRSGVFSVWMDKVRNAVEAGFGPRIIAFENVAGLVTSNRGLDFASVLTSISELGYRVGAVEIDAKKFVPQSRPRIFLIACRNEIDIPENLVRHDPVEPYHSKRLRRFVAGMNADLQDSWVWWDLPNPDRQSPSLDDIIDVRMNAGWFPQDKVQFLLSIMSDVNRLKLDERLNLTTPQIGMVYKRGRPDANGKIVQRAEIRFDGLAGCLRTPGGGSSRQTVMIVCNGEMRARLLSIVEAARLMGLPDSYQMPEKYNEAYKVAGDGVVVPIVTFLRDHLFNVLMSANQIRRAA